MGAASTTIGPVGAGSRIQALVRRLRTGDEIAHVITMIFGATIILITTMLVYQLWIHSAESRAKFGLHFLYTTTWDPVFETFRSAAIYLWHRSSPRRLALLIAVPLGLGAAIFLSELAPPKLSAGLSY